ncbi:hypothetical protein DFO79_12429 [Pseudidiomarina tainanensis]|jgi:hypothetical protein|uniref:Uncharacterized protein n=2 Tax=Pseudidiomarina TaxID=2800384 RepID=A0A368ULX9_9GAMM|nr:hypothetical protein DET45_12529 [Pseudidiomarina maritima]RBP86851.1 hypothetical protein DFO81_12529 [Pseudidiomarina tainanensis]RCW29020.1 hypothetical protein DFO79_12429 [Pseudidiomarina tainanensis]
MTNLQGFFVLLAPILALFIGYLIAFKWNPHKDKDKSDD